MRLDAFITDKFALKSRSYAQSLIKKGQVSVNGKVSDKAALDVDENEDVAVVDDDKFASQGAYKLEKALDVFAIDLSGKATADFGCSNGGFTDVMLRHGAKSVLAIDVGDCALDKSLLESGKVTFLKSNVRFLPENLPTVDFVSGDLSFISLSLVFASVFSLLKNGGEAVLLVKPQFEVGRSALSKKGIVTSEKERLRAVQSAKDSAKSAGFEVLGCTQSPIFYENKNIEYLLHLKKV